MQEIGELKPFILQGRL